MIKNRYSEEDLEENIEFPPHHDVHSYNLLTLENERPENLTEALKPIWYNWPIWEDTNKRKPLCQKIVRIIEHTGLFEEGASLEDPKTWIDAATSQECSDPEIKLKLLDNALAVTELFVNDQIWQNRQTIWKMMSTLGTDLDRRYSGAQP